MSSVVGVSSDSPSTFFGAFSTILFFNVSSGDFSFRLAGWDEKSRICNRGVKAPARVHVFGRDFIEDGGIERRNCLLQSLQNVW